MGAFTTAVMMGRCQSSGICEDWRDHLNVWERAGAMYELSALKTFGKSPSGLALLLRLRACWISDSLMSGFAMHAFPCVDGKWEWGVSDFLSAFYDVTL